MLFSIMVLANYSFESNLKKRDDLKSLLQCAFIGQREDTEGQLNLTETAKVSPPFPCPSQFHCHDGQQMAADVVIAATKEPENTQQTIRTRLTKVLSFGEF